MIGNRGGGGCALSGYGYGCHQIRMMFQLTHLLCSIDCNWHRQLCTKKKMCILYWCSEAEYKKFWQFHFWCFILSKWLTALVFWLLKVLTLLWQGLFFKHIFLDFSWDHRQWLVRDVCNECYQGEGIIMVNDWNVNYSSDCQRALGTLQYKSPMVNSILCCCINITNVISMRPWQTQDRENICNSICAHFFEVCLSSWDTAMWSVWSLLFIILKRPLLQPNMIRNGRFSLEICSYRPKCSIPYILDNSYLLFSDSFSPQCH